MWTAAGVAPTGGISNYFVGSAPANWHTNIPHYAQVKVSGVYHGIDIVFHGDRGSLEYDFVVAAGADPKQIQLQFEGASGLHVDKGDLVLSTPGGNELRHVRPKIHQQVGGSTSSTTFPGAPSIKPNPTAGYLVKLDNKGNGPIYTVLLGASVNGVAVIKPHPRVIVRPVLPTIFTAGIRYTGGTAQSNQDAFVVRVDEQSPIVAH